MATRLEYTPDEDIRVHEEGAIRLICAPFQSHENGLPEWLKNSADAYAREDYRPEKRVIVILLEHGRGRTSSISCLDLVGMTSEMIEGRFRVWADPEAARGGAPAAAVQGGHGNGGKCYMTQMFEDHAILRTARHGTGNAYGVDAGSVRFGYVPDRTQGRDFPVPDLEEDLRQFLSSIGCSLNAVREVGAEALADAQGYTLVTGLRPKGYGERIPVRQLIEDLEQHPQMIRTLEFCRVYVIANDEPYDNGRRLRLPAIRPMPGGEEPRVIVIPPALTDPVSRSDIDTIAGGSLRAGTLTLRTSSVSMRYAGRKQRHTIVYKAESGYIGYVPVTELDVQSAYRDRIYGDCELLSLDPFKQNDRGRLARSPLTRAVEAFISEQVEEYAREFEARDRRRYDQREKDALSEMNDLLNEWKDRFLGEFMQGLWGPGDSIAPPPPPPLPTGVPARLELALSHRRAGVGVSFRPRLHFYDREGRRIRPVDFRWFSDDNNVAMVDEDLNVINTFSQGATAIWAETIDRRLQSNKVSLDVVRIQEIEISPKEIEVPVGSRHRLEALCHLVDGQANDVLLLWTEDDSSIVRVSSAGLVYGFAVGETEVVAADENVHAREPARVRVVPAEAAGGGDTPGRGFPLVLISEVNRDPQTDDFVQFSREDPPVAQRPQDVDRNIWWINSAAPLARMYLATDRGYGYTSREWRMYHLERFVDVMVQISFAHGPEEADSLSAGDWILRWGERAAEIQAAAASGLAEFIATGAPPQEF